LYETLMPLVKEQVRSQIKVCDLSQMNVQVSPADYTSWSAAADALTREAVAPIKAQQRRELKKAAGAPDLIASINADFGERIEAEQSAVANTPLEFFCELGTEYNFL
jgi:hypothetical protein